MAKKKYIESPDKLQEYFEAYEKELKDNPKPKIIKGNKDFVVSDERLELPLTMEGFERYLFKKGIISDVSDYFENKENRYADYIPICRIIKKMIRADQIEGGMIGIYTPSITQRLNNLSEKQETKNEHTGDIKVTLNL